VAFAVASRPTTQTTDVQSAIAQITALAGQTLEVSRVEVWLPDEHRTAMRWIDGYECTSGEHPARPDIQLRDHPAYLSALDREPLVQRYELPASPSAAVCPHVDGAGLASVLEADVRVRGRNGVLCFQHRGHRSWTHDEERFASYLAHLVALAIEAWERHHAEAELRQACTALEHRSAELSGTVAMLNEHIVERRNAEGQLRTSQAQLRALSTRLLRAQEQERRRIAREIHDDLGQTLTALRLDVAWLGRRVDADAPAMREKLARMGELVDATVESVQAIARDLRPPILDDVGVAAAIEWQAKEFERHTGIRCRVRLGGDDIQLDADRSIALFRLVQEALTNVARHAYATRVTIALTEIDHTLVVVVRDNGRGMRTTARHRTGALGLLGMRERIHLCGGRLRIASRAGKGTVIRAQIPLVEPAGGATWSHA